ncbi:hypothetical protein B0H13DRAFT_2341786 [Mycena leptocephala]|nr:hypothetical protein B0H13DRAFT_2341786 [Mycena leptocephala]
MAFLPCPPPSSSCVDLNIEDYFNLDAASSSATGWQFLQQPQTAAKASLSTDFDVSILEKLVLDLHRDPPHNSHQIEVDLASIYPGPYHAPTLGLPLQATHGWASLPKKYDSSDSESCSSAPASPSSFFSTLSPPHSPISCGAEDVEISDNDHINCFRNSSPPPYTVVLNALPSTFHPETSPLPPFFDPSFFPSSTFVHASRPVSPRRDVVGGPENTMQLPAQFEPKYIRNQKSDLHSALPEDFQLIQLDDRSPSPIEYNAGPVHRTFTRNPDVPRHWKLKHGRPTPMMIFMEIGRLRQWCMGCLTVLSRADASTEYGTPFSLRFSRYIPKATTTFACGARTATKAFQILLHGISMKMAPVSRRLWILWL